jgi:hypothetical protein
MSKADLEKPAFKKMEKQRFPLIGDDERQEGSFL